MLPVGFLAVRNYYLQGYIDIKVVLVMCAAFVLGGYMGSKFTLSLPQETVKKFCSSAVNSGRQNAVFR